MLADETLVLFARFDFKVIARAMIVMAVSARLRLSGELSRLYDEMGHSTPGPGNSVCVSAGLLLLRYCEAERGSERLDQKLVAAVYVVDFQIPVQAQRRAQFVDSADEGFVCRELLRGVALRDPLHTDVQRRGDTDEEQSVFAADGEQVIEDLR